MMMITMMTTMPRVRVDGLFSDYGKLGNWALFTTDIGFSKLKLGVFFFFFYGDCLINHERK